MTIFTADRLWHPQQLPGNCANRVDRKVLASSSCHQLTTVRTFLLQRLNDVKWSSVILGGILSVTFWEGQLSWFPVTYSPLATTRDCFPSNTNHMHARLDNYNCCVYLKTHVWGEWNNASLWYSYVIKLFLERTWNILLMATTTTMVIGEQRTWR